MSTTVQACPPHLEGLRLAARQRFLSADATGTDIRLAVFQMNQLRDWFADFRAGKLFF